MKYVPYVFYRYSIEHDGTPVSGTQHQKLFIRLKGNFVAYRRVNPTSDDMDTALISLKRHTIAGEPILSFDIAKHVGQRKKKTYNRSSDEVEIVQVDADEYRTCQVVVLPMRGLLAAEDKTGESDIDAASAMGRMREIVKLLKYHRFIAEQAGTPADIRRALHHWNLEEVSYSARPFNPKVSRLGKILHGLLSPDNAKITGKATPVHGNYLNVQEGGLIEELMGLGEKGYAQIGARGKTPEGFEAKIYKGDTRPGQDHRPKFRIYFPEDVSTNDHLAAILDVMKKVFF